MNYFYILIICGVSRISGGGNTLSRRPRKGSGDGAGTPGCLRIFFAFKILSILYLFINSIEKLNFCGFLEKLLLKIDPSEITLFFKNLSHFEGSQSCPHSGGVYVIFLEHFRVIYTAALVKNNFAEQ